MAFIGKNESTTIAAHPATLILVAFEMSTSVVFEQLQAADKAFAASATAVTRPDKKKARTKKHHTKTLSLAERRSLLRGVPKQQAVVYAKNVEYLTRKSQTRGSKRLPSLLQKLTTKK